MFEKLFVEHPKSVGESYFQHMRMAFSFGGTMILYGLACLLHGFFPFLFETTGSRAVSGLYKRMVTHRDRRLVAAERDSSVSGNMVRSDANG